MLRTRRAQMAPLMLAAALAACSSTDSGTEGAALTVAEAAAAADVVVQDVADQVDGATLTGATSDFGFAAVEGGLSLEAPSSLVWWTAPCTPRPTRTVNGSTVTYVFTNCTLTRLLPPATITRNGTVAITAEAGLRRLVLTDFRTDWDRLSPRTGQREQFSETRSGTRQVTRDDGSVLTRRVYGATESAPFTTSFVGPDGGTGSHARNWESVFTADVAGSIQRDQPLPAGVFAISGTGEWTRSRDGRSVTASFVTSTGAQGLHFNPACETAGPPFDSGSLTVVATNRQGATSTIVVTFTACGQYSVERS